MGKRSQIATVIISGQNITATNSKNEPVKLSRQQRLIFSKHKNWNFRDMLVDEFGSIDNLPKEFRIIKDGLEVFKLHG